MCNKIAKQRRRLFSQNPHCYWCGKKVRWIKYKKRYVGCLPDDAATIDHLYSRLSPLRNIKAHGEVRHVLSCYKCNHERGRQEDQDLPVEEKLKRSLGLHKK